MSRTSGLFDYLSRSAAQRPDAVAVVDADGRAITYRELHDLALRAAALLASHGVQPGDRVGVIAPKSIEAVAALFGTMAAGAAYVPADFTAPAARNRRILEDCGVRALFLDAGAAAAVDDWPAKDRPEIVWLGVEGDQLPPKAGTPWADVLRHSPANGALAAGETHLAYILYTSGSTGQPKGVAITHGNATSFVEWCSREFAPRPHDRFGSHAPFHFDLSIFDLYVSLKHEATLYLVPEAVAKSPVNLAEFIAANRLTTWYSTPSILALLAQFGRLEERDCSSLRTVLFAGEVFPVKHLRAIVGQWPRAAFYNLYGPTETNVCTFARIPAVVPPDRAEPYPIGKLCDHCDGLVLDAAGGRVVPRGAEGLLHIAGPSVFQGYWNRHESGQFVERDGRRYYNTGDVVRETSEEGYVYVGRRDRMVKRRGFRIELGEIERGLYQSEKVREAAVIAAPDPESGVRIIACVSAAAGKPPSIVELKTFCGRVLPSYMNPDVFVILDALPQTSTGKVDYQRLTDLGARGRP